MDPLRVVVRLRQVRDSQLWFGSDRQITYVEGGQRWLATQTRAEWHSPNNLDLFRTLTLLGTDRVPMVGPCLSADLCHTATN